MLGLRVNNKYNQSYQRFQYPASGEVEAPDWNPAPFCGGGLHFFKDGEGDGSLISDEVKDPEAIWQIVEADGQLAVDLGGKYKAPKLKVLEAGPKEEILKKLRSLVGPDKAILFESKQVGSCGTAVVGDFGTALAGDYGTALAECEGTAIVGIGGVATAGISGILIFRAKSGVPVSFSVDGQKVKADRAYTFLGDQLAEVPGLDPIYRS